MPNRRFDWHEHIKEIEGEYRAARTAVDRLQAQVIVAPDILLTKDGPTRSHLQDAKRNLEGTYLVRLFAAFEAALRSYDRAWRGDPTRNVVASVLIDSIYGHRRISHTVYEGAHAVRRVRNYWAHESDAKPDNAAMTIKMAQGLLQTYLAWLPIEWE